MAIKLSDHFTYKKLFRFCFPSIIMMIFTSIYGVVDGLFVSNFVGKTAFASINLVMPFIMIIGAFGFMIGTGGSALVSAVMGRGDKEKANRYFTMMVMAAVICGIIISIIGVICIRPIAYMLGATDAMISDCVIYGRIAVSFNTMFMLQNLFQTFLTTSEKPKLGLAVMLAAGCTNMVLDALFVGVLKWGVAGAAIATGLSECVGGIIPLIYFLRPNKSLLRLCRTKLQFSPVFKACTNGVSELMSSISGSVVSMVYNYQLLKFAGENGVATYGVLMYIQFIFVAAFIGYTIGSAPVIGYHYGAGNRNELRNMLKKSFIITGIAGVGMMILAQILSGTFARIFVGYDLDLFHMTKQAFRIFSISFILTGMNIFASSFFTALNNGKVSAAISFLRTLVFQMFSVLLLPLIFGLNGIWWANSVAEVCAFIISIACIRHYKGYYLGNKKLK